VAVDGLVDRGGGALPEPVEQHRRDRPTIAPAEPKDELVALLATFARHLGPRRVAGQDPEPVQLAAVANGRTVTKSAPRGELGTGCGHRGEVAPDPRLALGEEALDERLRPRPPPTGGGRHADDGPPIGLDRDAQPPRPRRAAEDVAERTAGQPGDGERFAWAKR
jgi:hypothetical protein